MSHRTAIGTFTATCLVVGTMVGTGVYTSLGFQLIDIHSGSSIMLLWLIGGILALAGALCYAELASRFPRSGGEYHLITKAVHPAAGFAVGWISAFAGFGIPAALGALTLGEYVNHLLPHIDARWVALRVLLLVTGIQLLDLRFSGGFMNLFTVVKVLFIVGFIGAAFFWMPEPKVIHWTPRWANLVSAPFAVSLVWVSYSYTGWNAAIYIIDDMKEPQCCTPRALLGGTLLVTLLYMGINAAFMRAAPIPAMLGHEEVGLIAGQHLFGPRGGTVVAVFICLGLLSLVSAVMLAGPRVLQRMGQDYGRLSVLARTTDKGVAWVSTLVIASIAAIAIMTSSVYTIMAFTGFVLGLVSLFVVLTVPWLRIRKPKQLGAFRMRAWPIAPTIFALGMLWMLIFVAIDKPWQSLLGIVLCLLSLPVYALIRNSRHS